MHRMRSALRAPAIGLVIVVLIAPVLGAAATSPVEQTTQAARTSAGAPFASWGSARLPDASERLPLRRASRSHAWSEPVFVAPGGERISASRVRAYLLRKHSPLAFYAEDLVRTAVRWRVDPRVVIAISGVESSFGRVRRGYNAWGWGVATIRYASWTNAIHRFVKAFSLHYPTARNGNFGPVAARYDPPSPSTWAAAARAYFNAI